MATENPFEVMTQQLQAAELQTPPQYRHVWRLRFLVCSVGVTALTMLLFVALLKFAGGLGVLALPVLFVGWYATHIWLIRARLRNAGYRQWWLLIPSALLFTCYPGFVFATSNNAKALADLLAQLTSLLMILNLPILVICLTIPTAFADRRKIDRHG